MFNHIHVVKKEVISFIIFLFIIILSLLWITKQLSKQYFSGVDKLDFETIWN